MAFGLELGLNSQLFLLWPRHTLTTLYSVFMRRCVVSTDNYKIKILINTEKHRRGSASYSIKYAAKT